VSLSTPLADKALVKAATSRLSGTFAATVDGYTPVGTISNPFPTGILYPLGSQAGPAGSAGSAISSLLYSTDSAYVHQYTFGVENSILKSGVFRITYVGSHGVKLPISLFPNSLNPKYFGAPGSSAQVAFLQSTKPNPFAKYVSSGTLAQATISQQQLLAAFPQYASVGEQSVAKGSNHYNALQVSVLEKTNNLTLTAAYTWAKVLGVANNDVTSSLDTGSPQFQNSYVMDIEKSVTSTDITHRLTASAVFLLPFGKGQRFLNSGSRWLNLATSGWKLTAIQTLQGGLPLNITNTGAPPFAGSRPNFVVGQPHTTSGDVHNRLGGMGQKQGYINSAAFVYPQSFVLGNVPRISSDIRAPGVINTDASGTTEFSLTESTHMRFSAQAFNLFNRVQFGRPNTTFGGTTFGYISSQAHSPRQIQLGLRLIY